MYTRYLCSFYAGYANVKKKKKKMEIILRDICFAYSSEEWYNVINNAKTLIYFIIYLKFPEKYKFQKHAFILRRVIEIHS